MAESGLRSALQTLFSSNVVVHNVGGDQIKVVDTSGIQSTAQNYMGSGPNIHSGKGSSGSGLMGGMSGMSQGGGAYADSLPRRRLYHDYELMDKDAIVNSALDFYASESVVEDEHGDVLTIETDHPQVDKILHNLYYEVLNIEFNLQSWIRDMCKYGDSFIRLYIDYESENQMGVYNCDVLSPYHVERIEGGDPSNPFEIKFAYDGPKGEDELGYWEVGHFSMRDSAYAPYGRSCLEGARNVFKRLTMMEDAMLIHRIMRAPERRVFKLDVGNLQPGKIDSFMEKTKQELKSQPLVDPETGEYDLEFNLMNMMDDYFMPVRGRDDGTEISTLNSLNWQAIEDVEYLRQKMMSALRVPNAFLGYERDIEGKCIAPSTEIPLMSGETVEAKDIVEHYQENEEPDSLYTYSYDQETGKIVAGEVKTAEWTRENATVVDVNLDNGKTITTTPDHKFLTRSGKWIEAQNLGSGNSLMPLYKGETEKENMSGYETVYHPGEEKYEPTHRAVENQFNLKEKHGGSVVHHEDFDKKNNRPDNLDCSMGFHEHRQFHQDHAEKTINSEKAIQKRTKDSKWIESARQAGKKGGESNAEWLSEYASGRESANKNGENLDCQHCGCSYYVPGYRVGDSKYCSDSCKAKSTKNWTDKISDIEEFDLLEKAKGASSFSEIENKLDITRKTFNKLIENLEISKNDLVENYMDTSYQFENARKNHKVESVEVRNEKVDTVDIQVKEYKNFATEAGVIVHNSTLAQESIKFANIVNQIQKIIANELTKIGIVHLFSQGIRDERLVDFSLGLTHPSHFVEQQKIDLLESKYQLVRTAEDQNLHSTEWLMRNVFNMNQEEIKKERLRKVEDWKREFVKEQLTREGNNPLKTGMSYGTPGDLAMSGASELQNFDEPAEEDVEPEDDEGYSLAPDNPFEKPSDSDFKTTSGDVSQNYQGGSPLAAGLAQAQKHHSNLIQESLEDSAGSTSAEEVLSESELDEQLRRFDWLREENVVK